MCSAKPGNHLKGNADDPSQVNTLVREAEQFIRKRQKLIKIADHRKDSCSRIWVRRPHLKLQRRETPQESEKCSGKKRKNPEKSKVVSSKRFKSDNDNQLFCGNIFLLSSLLCYFSLRWNAWESNHRIALFVLYVLHLIGKYDLRSFERSDLERHYLKSI